jgi:hypothetical protein
MPPSLNFPQLDFVEPSSGFHPMTWERVSDHRHALEPGRQAVQRSEPSHEEPTTTRTPDSLDQSDDSSRQHRRQGE